MYKTNCVDLCRHLKHLLTNMYNTCHGKDLDDKDSFPLVLDENSEFLKWYLIHKAVCNKILIDLSKSKLDLQHNNLEIRQRT